MTSESAPRYNNFERSIYNEDGSYTKEYAKSIIDSKIRIVPSENVTEIAREQSWQIAPKVPGLPENMSIIAAPDVPLEKEATPHENSGAEYIVSATKGNYYRFTAPDGRECILFFWGMKPNDSTSKTPHVHGHGTDGKGIYEHHFVKAGDIVVNGKVLKANSLEEEDQDVPDYERVSPFTTHQAFSGENGAVVAILLENVRGIPDHEIHLYPDQSESILLINEAHSI